MNHIQERRQSMENDPKIMQTLELAHENLKIAIINMVKNVKKNIFVMN